MTEDVEKTIPAGDQVGHLEWRLQNGDIPQRHHPKAAVIMIGTNDLGAAQGCSGGSAQKILETAEGVKSRSISAHEPVSQYKPQIFGLLVEAAADDELTFICKALPRLW